MRNGERKEEREGEMKGKGGREGGRERRSFGRERHSKKSLRRMNEKEIMIITIMMIRHKVIRIKHNNMDNQLNRYI